MKYRLNRNIYYIDEHDGSISDIRYTRESKLYTKKGRLYNKIKVPEDSLCSYIYKSINGKRNDIYIYSGYNDWFDEVKE